MMFRATTSVSRSLIVMVIGFSNSDGMFALVLMTFLRSPEASKQSDTESKAFAIIIHHRALTSEEQLQGLGMFDAFVLSQA